jgi:uncharacterized protein (TIGR01777 family)
MYRKYPIKNHVWEEYRLKVAITGGTGFVGSYLVDYYAEMKADVIIISRSCNLKKNQNHRAKCITWDQLDDQINQLEGLDALINLAGESIDQRWTDKSKNMILHSRLDAAKQIAKVVDRLLTKPKVVINGSGMSIYGTSETDAYDETSPSKVDDFLSSVVNEWEMAADLIKGTRLIKLRIGMVLGKNHGALPKMVIPYRLGVGGRVGSGQQWFSWIHIDDMVRLIQYCIENEEIIGPVNATAPNPVTNDQFGQAVGQAWHRPHYFPVPAFVFKLIFGEMSDLLLKGQQVYPRVVLDHGFEFTYSKVEEALKQIANREKQ